MKAVAFLEGRWAGEGWIQMGPGPKEEFSQTEVIERKLDGGLLLIEGIGRSRDPEPVFRNDAETTMTILRRTTAAWPCQKRINTPRRARSRPSEILAPWPVPFRRRASPSPRCADRQWCRAWSTLEDARASHCHDSSRVSFVYLSLRKVNPYNPVTFGPDSRYAPRSL